MYSPKAASRLRDFTHRMYLAILADKRITVRDSVLLRRRTFSIFIDMPGTVSDVYAVLGKAMEKVWTEVPLRPDMQVSASGVAGSMNVCLTFSL
jgi:hypothetical protein